ncbi:MAG: 3-dehydroquinate synthase [Chloroflexota bacterium]|nr:3-dehydroquinate synthase [Chloroflexota bacterium]
MSTSSPPQALGLAAPDVNAMHPAPQRIFLVGISGSGKSTVGRRVAELLGWSFVDTDRLIEARAGRPVAAIFADQGEPAFRALEAQAMAEAAARDRVVVATGGGALLTPEGRRAARTGFVVWLAVPPDVAAARLLADPEAEVRPLLGGDAAARLRELLSRRRPLYSTADVVIDAAGASPEDVAQAVVAAYRRALAGAWGIPGVACEVTAPGGRYPVIVREGALGELGAVAAALGFRGRSFIVTDEVVGPRFAGTAVDSLAAAGLEPHVLELPAGEPAKTLATVERVYSWLAGLRAERGELVVCLGGGVITDLAGFAAATYLRGMPFIHVPTTLLAMVDAAIGGKTGVDLPAGKNLVGAFAQPAAVVIDPAVLAGLPEREVRAGLAELIKHGLILDEGLVADLERLGGHVASMLSPALIARSVAIKAAIVSADERESGLRSLLNYGHTIGHAIEAVTGYARYLHGEAVAVGMHAAGRIAVELGVLPPDGLERQQALLRSVGLPERAPDVPFGLVLERTLLDKKVRGGRVRWVLLERIGRATLREDVPESVVRAAAAEVLGG